jgi:hypothetical protein
MPDQVARARFVFTPLFSGFEHVPIGARRSDEEPALAEDGLRPTAATRIEAASASAPRSRD